MLLNSSKTNKEGVPFVLLDHLWWSVGTGLEDNNYLYTTEKLNTIYYYKGNSTYILNQTNGYNTLYDLTIVSKGKRK